MSENWKEPPLFPELPKTSVEAIEATGLQQELFDRLCSGWSPARASTWLREQGYTISALQVKRFFDEIPDIYVLPPTLVRTKLKMLDVKIDSLTGLGRAVRLMEERIDAHLLLLDMQAENPQAHSVAATNKAYRKDLEAYFSMLERYTRLLQSLGILDRVPQRFDITSDGEKLPTLRAILEGRDAARSDRPGADSGST